jgi:hypothetical protein
MSRGNQILAILLVVQLALAAVVLWPRSASTAGGEPLFPGLEADQVVRVTIADGEGERIELTRNAGQWGLAEADNYPCQEDAVDDIIGKVAAITTDRLITRTPASHKRLQVADGDYARLVELELADGAVHQLYLGTSPSYGMAHVRAAGEDAVYLASDLSSTDVNASASAWVDTLYLSVPGDQIVGLTLENGNGMFEFQKGEGGAWTMVGLSADETANANNVESLANRVSSVRMLRPLGTEAQEEYGLQDPSAVVLIRTQDEAGAIEVTRLHVGSRSDEDGSYVVKTSKSAYYVRVAEYTAGDLVDKMREDFLELPPTATPQPAS